MKIKSNRFAILPIECNVCQNYVWLEPYRIGEEWHTFLDTFVKVKICRDCYKRYRFGNDSGNRSHDSES